jgi:AraC-like DNA-binding protein
MSMLAHSHIPSPPFSDFVALCWLYEGRHRPHTKERALPTGTTELVINLRDDQITIYDRDDPARSHQYPGAIICGPHAEYFVIDRDEQGAILGVHFKPGGARPFFGHPAADFRDRHVALADVWGARAGEVRERLIAAPTPAEKFRLLERALLAAARTPVRHPAVAFALREFRRAPDVPTIAAVAGRLGLGARRFGDLFAAEVGLTPKLYCRVRRFQALLHRIEADQPVDWAGLAAACGYYDQAHCIRDFRAFSGLNPTAYLAQRGDHPNHVPLAG